MRRGRKLRFRSSWVGVQGAAGVFWILPGGVKAFPAGAAALCCSASAAPAKPRMLHENVWAARCLLPAPCLCVQGGHCRTPEEFLQVCEECLACCLLAVSLSWPLRLGCKVATRGALLRCGELRGAEEEDTGSDALLLTICGSSVRQECFAGLICG